jgi:hypothetical protein
MNKGILEICMTVTLTVANASVIILLLVAWIGRITYEKMHSDGHAPSGVACCRCEKTVSLQDDGNESAGLELAQRRTGSTYDVDALDESDPHSTLPQPMRAEQEASSRGFTPDCSSFHESANPLNLLKSRAKTARSDHLDMTVREAALAQAIAELTAKNDTLTAENAKLIKALQQRAKAGAVTTLEAPPTQPAAETVTRPDGAIDVPSASAGGVEASDESRRRHEATMMAGRERRAARKAKNAHKTFANV